MEPKLTESFKPKWWWRFVPGHTAHKANLEQIAVKWSAQLDGIDNTARESERIVREFLATNATKQCETGLEYALVMAAHNIDAGRKLYNQLLEDCVEAESHIASVNDLELARDLRARINTIQLETYAQLRTLPEPLFTDPA